LQRTLLITGATRGIGRGLAEAAIAAGHVVLGCGRNRDQIAQLQSQVGAPHRFEVVDVADDRQVSEWADSLVNAELIPDLVFNNAGLINQPAPLWKVPAEEFDAIVDVNIRGVASVIRHFAPPMIKSGTRSLRSSQQRLGTQHFRRCRPVLHDETRHRRTIERSRR